jgi:hypothetical protein
LFAQWRVAGEMFYGGNVVVIDAYVFFETVGHVCAGQLVCDDFSTAVFAGAVRFKY